MNFILDTDSYKLSHFLGYPKDAEHIYSYAESRGGRYPATVFFGIQKFVKDLAKVRVTREDVEEAHLFAEMHGEPFNSAGWLRIVREHNGRIPVRIKAVPEGTLVPVKNVLVTVENTDPTMPWLTSYIETALLRATWYPTTVATRIHYMKQKVKPYFDRTSDTSDMGFAILDFGARGASSRETAELGGMAHLVHFVGSDNIPAILAARDYYSEPMAAFSVPATEHSVTTSWGIDGEDVSIEHLIDNMMPENGILSVVADTWNVYEFAKKLTLQRQRIRNKNGTIVIRPDSGDFREVLPKVMKIMVDGFGVNVNDKGYGVIRDAKILQGDGINEQTVHIPFQIAENLGISADSVMTGSGGGLLQANIDRDTCKFAFKASCVTRSGVDIPIAKNPITDPGKMSKQGKLKLVEGVNGFYTTAERSNLEDHLQLIYEDGITYNEQTFADIRKRAAL